MTRFLSKLLVAVLLAAFFHQSALAARETVLDRIVAVINDGVILQSELERELKTIKARIRQSNTPLPPDDVLKRQVLDRLILKKLQLQLAERTGIYVDDETVNQTIQRIAEQNKLSVAELRRRIQNDGMNYEQYREDLRDEIAMNRLRQRQVEGRVEVSEEGIDTYLANLKTQGAINDEYRLGHILISVPEAATPEQIQTAEAKANEIVQQLRGGADFAKTAISVSDGQQALEGGDLGWRKTGQLPTIFASEVRQMKTGDVSDPIRSPSGFHILKLKDYRTGKTHYVTQTHARHILIRVDEKTSANEAKTRLKQLRRQIRNGADFASLAKEYSADPGSAAKGGDLDWINPGTMVPEFERVMDKLKPGQISQPFKTRFGWHIIQVLDRRKYDASQDMQHNRARQLIRERKIEEETDNWLRQLRDEAYVEKRLGS